MKTYKNVMNLLAGKYPIIAFGVYCYLMSLIEDSNNGEAFFTKLEMQRKFKYSQGKRPIKAPYSQIRKAINSLWEDGIFEFMPTPHGTYVRLPTDKQWVSKIILE